MDDAAFIVAASTSESHRIIGKTQFLFNSWVLKISLANKQDVFPFGHVAESEKFELKGS